MEAERKNILINITEMLMRQGLITEAERLQASNIINKDI